MARLKIRGSRHFGPMAKRRQALEKQIAYEIKDASANMDKLWPTIRWLWLNRAGTRSFLRGVFLYVRMRLVG